MVHTHNTNALGWTQLSCCTAVAQALHVNETLQAASAHTLQLFYSETPVSAAQRSLYCPENSVVVALNIKLQGVHSAFCQSTGVS